MLLSLKILPPLAFARVGRSTTPCPAFSWAATDTSPGGTGKTSLEIEETLELDAAGAITATRPNSIGFKDADGAFRPVCPFFELHGSWELGGNQHSGPITAQVLEDNGLSPSDLSWTVTLGNLKAFHFTLDEGDRITADVTVAGDDTERKALEGRSPTGPGIQPLIPPSDPLPMGAVQLARLDDPEFPEMRLRFYSPPGITYGPPNLADRINAFADIGENAEWIGFDLPTAQKIVNPAARWATLNLDEEGPPPIGGGDPRNAPGGLSASLFERRGQPPFERTVRISMGLVDDVSDGLITCEVGGVQAFARIAVGPQDFAPMARPFVSLQDGLADRMLRDDVRDDSIDDDELEAIVADIFERALETSDLMNKDAQNDRSRQTNFARPGGVDLPAPSPDFEASPRRTLWRSSNPLSTNSPAAGQSRQADAMPVSQQGQRKHRRYNAIEYIRDRLREEPDLIEKWIRLPLDNEPLFDRRMPALMRGSDGQPMHLTRRQYEMIRRWAARQHGGGIV